MYFKNKRVLYGNPRTLGLGMFANTSLALGLLRVAKAWYLCQPFRLGSFLLLLFFLPFLLPSVVFFFFFINRDLRPRGSRLNSLTHSLLVTNVAVVGC
jgi:hypothetical protein